MTFLVNLKLTVYLIYDTGRLMILTSGNGWFLGMSFSNEATME